MRSSTVDQRSALACDVIVTDEVLEIHLSDGRTVTAPLAWYPRLQHGSAAERKNWRPIGRGEGIHWPDLDEDISVADVLAGKASGESQASLKRWLADRAKS
jgi:hypothetical protein